MRRRGPFSVRVARVGVGLILSAIAAVPICLAWLPMTAWAEAGASPQLEGAQASLATALEQERPAHQRAVPTGTGPLVLQAHAHFVSAWDARTRFASLQETSHATGGTIRPWCGEARLR